MLIEYVTILHQEEVGITEDIMILIGAHFLLMITPHHDKITEVRGETGGREAILQHLLAEEDLHLICDQRGVGGHLITQREGAVQKEATREAGHQEGRKKRDRHLIRQTKGRPRRVDDITMIVTVTFQGIRLHLIMKKDRL